MGRCVRMPRELEYYLFLFCVCVCVCIYPYNALKVSDLTIYLTFSFCAVKEKSHERKTMEMEKLLPHQLRVTDYYDHRGILRVQAIVESL